MRLAIMLFACAVCVTDREDDMVGLHWTRQRALCGEDLFENMVKEKGKCTSSRSSRASSWACCS